MQARPARTPPFLQERHARRSLEAQTEGAIHTARNLGQLAAYFLQTGAMQEAADFYLQASECLSKYVSSKRGIWW